MQGYSLIRADHPEDVKRVVSAWILSSESYQTAKTFFHNYTEHFNARSKSWWPEDVTSHEDTDIVSLTTMHCLQQLILDPTHCFPIHHHVLTLYLLTNQT